MLIGYARCSTNEQDVASQVLLLEKLGAERMYLDRGWSTGKAGMPPELDKALAACREGDTLVVTRLDRYARSLRNALDLADALDQRGVLLSINGTVYDRSDPMGALFFQLLAMFAEFERALIRQRTREGMAAASKRGRLKGKQPKLSPAQEKALCRSWMMLDDSGEYPTISELAEVYMISRASVYRTLRRHELYPRPDRVTL